VLYQCMKWIVDSAATCHGALTKTKSFPQLLCGVCHTGHTRGDVAARAAKKDLKCQAPPQ